MEKTTIESKIYSILFFDILRNKRKRSNFLFVSPVP